MFRLLPQLGQRLQLSRPTHGGGLTCSGRLAQVNSDPKSALGTLAYTAPEALMHNFFDGSSSDVWSCGVMLYIMVTGECRRQGSSMIIPAAP